MATRYSNLWLHSGDHEVLTLRPTIAMTMLRWRGVVKACAWQCWIDSVFKMLQACRHRWGLSCLASSPLTRSCRQVQTLIVCHACKSRTHPCPRSTTFSGAACCPARLFLAPSGKDQHIWLQAKACHCPCCGCSMGGFIHAGTMWRWMDEVEDLALRRDLLEDVKVCEGEEGGHLPGQARALAADGGNRIHHICSPLQ